MRLGLASTVAALAALLAAGPALGQATGGVTHPSNESGKSLPELGAELYAGNCAVCHGIDGRGVYGPPQRGSTNIKGMGPTLRGVGAMAAHLYLTTGFMPLETVNQQPYRKRVMFNKRELAALIGYVASLSPGPPIPHPNPAAGNVAGGLRAFTDHCAGCHQVVAEGGYVTDIRVPLIKQDTPVQIAEAVRVGPYLMPAFSKKSISDRELNSIIAYLQASKKPDDHGGWGIGHIGPVPEGIVTWFIAAVALIATCALIGKRLSS